MKSISLFIFLSISSFVFGQSPNNSLAMKSRSDPIITVVELRNYLLKPNSYERFSALFNNVFVAPSEELGGYILGQFRIPGERDRFVWIRGFQDMRTRLKTLNDFYLHSEVWKKHRNEANGMMINSDNVYLLRPLTETGAGLNRDLLQNNGEVVVVDFYICNSTRDKVIDLFKSEYLPFMRSLNIPDPTLWVSEMSENDFPRLPVFQDKNLLVTMTRFKNELAYRKKSKQIGELPPKLRMTMQELITTRNQLVLYPVNTPLRRRG
jgi:hypothetical protein